MRSHLHRSSTYIYIYACVHGGDNRSDHNFYMREHNLESNNSSYNDERLRNTYKKIKFKPSVIAEWREPSPTTNAATTKEAAKPYKSVSFDTVPSMLGTSSYEEHFEGLKLPSSVEFNTKKKQIDNLNNLTFNSYNNIDKLFHITPEGKIVRKDYPSRPTITNDAMIINKFYLNWLQRWQNHKLHIENRLNDKTHWFKYPDIIMPDTKMKPIIMEEDYVPLTKHQRKRKIILNTKTPNVNLPRTILCHINGRKHTWVALDWWLDIALHDMDHLVILTNIPRVKLCSNKNKAKNQTEHDDDDGEPWGDSLIYERLQILEICQNILTYTHLFLSRQQNSVKITIDIVIGKTKKVFVDAINIYTPDLIIVPTLKWERNDKLIENKYSSSLKDNLCIYFPIPVGIVPVKRMYQFQLNLQDKINNNKDTYNNNKQIDSSENHLDRDVIDFESTQSSNSSTSSSINSFTADYNSEMTNLSDNVSIPCRQKERECKEKDNEYKDQNLNTLNDEQFLSDIQDLPIVSQLYLVAKRYRRKMQDGLGEMENARSYLTKSQLLIGKLDCVVNTSLEGSLMINSIKGNQLSDDVNLKGFARLKRVITGGEPTYSPSYKPMTDVSGYKSTLSHRKDIASPKKGSSQIIFASDVKVQDGKRALGNWKSNKMSSSNTTSPPIIERVSSSDEVRSIHSNESERSGMSITSDFLFPKRLPVFNSNTKKSASTPSSRRNSDSNEKPKTLGSGGKRKMISKLFGFK